MRQSLVAVAIAKKEEEEYEEVRLLRGER
jgi:hypothetical protein